MTHLHIPSACWRWPAQAAISSGELGPSRVSKRSHMRSRQHAEAVRGLAIHRASLMSASSAVASSTPMHLVGHDAMRGLAVHQAGASQPGAHAAGLRGCAVPCASVHVLRHGAACWPHTISRALLESVARERRQHARVACRAGPRKQTGERSTWRTWIE